MRRFLAVIYLLANAACQTVAPTIYHTSTPAPTSTARPDWKNFNGTKWTLIELLGKPVLPSSEVTLEFVDNTMQGVAGCNRYWQMPYTSMPDTSNEVAFRITVQLCTLPGLIEQEDVYIKQITSVSNTFEVDKEKLIVKNSTGDIVLIFVEQ